MDSNPFGKSEYYFFNGLSAGGLGFKYFQGIPPYYHSLLHGHLYQRRDYNGDGDEVARQTFEYDIETEKERLRGSGKVYLYGFYIQQKRSKSIIYAKEIGSTNSHENASNVGVKQ